MALTTYAELQTSIAGFLNRDDLTAVVPDFITLAEASMQRDLKHWRMEKRATASIDARFSAVPDDFVSPVRFQVGTTDAPMQPISVQDMHDRRNARDDDAGTPCFYALVGDEFEFMPTPSAALTATLYYRAKVPALSDSNTSNWVLANAPDVYLYGALIHTAPYLVEDARVATWGGLYAQAVAQFNKQGEAGKFGGAGKRRKVRK